MRESFYAALLLGGLAAVPALGFPGGGMMGAEFDFAAADTNGDGQLSKDEMEAVRAARIAKIDANGDGQITNEELTAYMQAEQAERVARMVRVTIAKLDDNGDGTLSIEEMEPGQRADRMFSRMDTNDDGQISEDELEAAREHMRERGRGKGGMGPGGMGPGGDDEPPPVD